MISMLRLLATAGVMLASTCAALAGTPAATTMVIGAETSQPIGHFKLCKRMPAECRHEAADSLPRHLTPEAWAAVDVLNRSVNARIAPKSDRFLYGQEEFWTYPTVEGDCEDYALLKRRELAGQGWDLSDLLLTMVRKPDGEGHAVLTLRTRAGDFILDNLDHSVRPWNETNYTFVKRQSSTHTGRWVTIEADRDDIVGSVQ
jgi:predicted transglutaminase-like cysteine proteinase